MAKLVRVEQPSHWQSLHSIRGEVLFGTDTFPIEYDEHHPDDRCEGNTPYLLASGGSMIGAVRLDRRGAIGIVRLFGIRSAAQSRGNGRRLGELIDVEAKATGIAQLCVNASREAIGFYEKTGWRHAIWDQRELISLAGRGAQMIKEI